MLPRTFNRAQDRTVGLPPSSSPAALPYGKQPLNNELDRLQCSSGPIYIKTINSSLYWSSNSDSLWGFHNIHEARSWDRTAVTAEIQKEYLPVKSDKMRNCLILFMAAGTHTGYVCSCTTSYRQLYKGYVCSCTRRNRQLYGGYVCTVPQDIDRAHLYTSYVCKTQGFINVLKRDHYWILSSASSVLPIYGLY